MRRLPNDERRASVADSDKAAGGILRLRSGGFLEAGAAQKDQLIEAVIPKSLRRAPTCGGALSKVSYRSSPT